MKKSILVFGFMFAIFMITNSAYAQGVTWFNFNDGLKKAQKENKILLIDVYTDWCGWCKKMDKDIYNKAEIKTALSKKFIPVKFNPEAAGEYILDNKKYTGKELVDFLTDNKLTGYPTTCFYYPKSKKCYMEIGYIALDRMKPMIEKYAKMK